MATASKFFKLFTMDFKLTEIFKTVQKVVFKAF